MTKISSIFDGLKAEDKRQKAVDLSGKEGFWDDRNKAEKVLNVGYPEIKDDLMKRIGEEGFEDINEAIDFVK